MDLLIINGHDYSCYATQRGYGWSRNDLDSTNSTRGTKNGRMRRDKITTKRKLTFTVRGMTREMLAQLDNDLSAVTFQATYMDLHGQMTREFYCPTFQADMVSGKHDTWESQPFDITEV